MEDKSWHMAKASSGERYGPYPGSELRVYMLDGRVEPDDLIWCEGMPAWERAEPFLWFAKLDLSETDPGPAAPPPMPAVARPPDTPSSIGSAADIQASDAPVSDDGSPQGRPRPAPAKSDRTAPSRAAAPSRPPIPPAALTGDTFSALSGTPSRPAPREDRSVFGHYRAFGSGRTGRALTLTEAELEAFVVSNGDPYLRFLDRLMAKRGKIWFSWSWAAFFFGAIWLAYRRLYSWTILLLMLAGLGGAVEYFMADLTPVSRGLGIVIAMVLALFAKPLIVLRAQAAVEGANRRGLESLERGAYLKGKGGVSWWAAILVAGLLIGTGLTFAVKTGAITVPALNQAMVR